LRAILLIALVSSTTRIIFGTDAGELLQSSSIAGGLLTQGVALGWNLQTPSALVMELYDFLQKHEIQSDKRCIWD